MGMSLFRFRCRPGTFNLQPHNPAGCSSCFCYGHSKVCAAAAGFREHHILSNFRQGKRCPLQPPPRGLPPARWGQAVLLRGDPAMVVWVRLPQVHMASCARCAPLCRSALPRTGPHPSVPSPAFSRVGGLGRQQPLDPVGEFLITLSRLASVSVS